MVAHNNMTWFYGIHLKWRTTKDYATRKRIKVRVWEFLPVAVTGQLRLESRVPFWMNFDWQFRPIITFAENDTDRSAKGMPFTVAQIVWVMKLLGVRKPPRWYTDIKAHDDQQDDGDSSGNDELGTRGISGRPEWIETPPSSDGEADSDDGSEEGDSEETLVDDVENYPVHTAEGTEFVAGVEVPLHNESAE